jgi:hypothetical protein
MTNRERGRDGPHTKEAQWSREAKRSVYGKWAIYVSVREMEEPGHVSNPSIWKLRTCHIRPGTVS